MTQSLKVKAVIFDRDGVIINTDGIVIYSVKEAFKRLGFVVQDEDVPQIIGRSFDVYKDYFVKKWDFNLDEYRKIQNGIFYENLNKAEFFQGALDLIKCLHTKKVPIAVTTSAGREGTMLILNKAGIAEMFDVIITKDDITNFKPHPEPYLKTAEKLGVEAKYCVAIEDTALGVESAKNAGMMCIAIPNEHTRDQDFSTADVVLESANEVEKILEFI